jgi:hypothetical protein
MGRWVGVLRDSVARAKDVRRPGWRPWVYGILVASVALAWPVGARAQGTVEFFPETRFFIDAQHLSHDDIRFGWDANFHGEADLLGWPGGRATFVANYEVGLGDELRRFDPNQGNYLLEGTVTQRVAGVEISGQFHHVSRHLADRPKIAPVDWNMLGVRVGRRMVNGRLTVQGHVDLRKTVAKSFVDYTREAEGDLRVRWVLRPRVALMSNTRLRVVGTDGTGNRGTQTGARVEGGVHLGGDGGGLELFVAFERRIDPYPTDFSSADWLTAGFRLLGR